jgi:preprotein translocase subunit SecA
MVFEQEDLKAPSFTYHLIVEEITNRIGEDADDVTLKDCLLKIASETLEAEIEHLLRNARSLLEKTEDTVNEVTADRLDALDSYFEGLEMGGDEEGQPIRRPQEILEEISGLVSTPLRLSTEDLRQLTDGNQNSKNALVEQVKNTVKSLAITRTIYALEMRLDESLNMKPGQLIDLDWDEITDGLFRAVETSVDTRSQALLTENGMINNNIDNALSRGSSNNDDYVNKLTSLLIAMSSGTRMAIDPRTHQKVMRNVRILNYIFFAAKLIQEVPVKEITSDILEHLEDTRQRLEEVWGKMEFERFRLAGVPLSQLDAKIKETLVEEFGADVFGKLDTQRPEDLSPEQQEILTITLGTRIQNEIYRHILVSVFSEHWVEYLTKVDALRVSIGMEAFAQRDPLVQYKSEAASMFKQLLSDIRSGVISKMFLFQPRRAGSSVEKTTGPQPATLSTPKEQIETGSKKKKRKRH